MDVSPTRIALVQLVDYVEATFRPLTAEKGLDFSVRVSPGTARHAAHRRTAPPPGAAQPAVERGEVHRRRRGRTRDPPGRRGHPATPSASSCWRAGSLTRRRTSRSDRLLGHRHRHRDRGQQDAGHLRGVQAGRRHHQPQVRRYGPGTVHQPGDRPAARRRDPGRQRAGPRLDLHALPAAQHRRTDAEGVRRRRRARGRRAVGRGDTGGRSRRLRRARLRPRRRPRTAPPRRRRARRSGTGTLGAVVRPGGAAPGAFHRAVPAASAARRCSSSTTTSATSSR